MSQNIGFISTRFAGQDGVSLESAKWAEVLWEDRHISYWYSGQSDRLRVSVLSYLRLTLDFLKTSGSMREFGGTEQREDLLPSGFVDWLITSKDSLFTAMLKSSASIFLFRRIAWRFQCMYHWGSP